MLSRRNFLKFIGAIATAPIFPILPAQDIPLHIQQVYEWDISYAENARFDTIPAYGEMKLGVAIINPKKIDLLNATF